MTYNPQKNHPRQRVSTAESAPIDVLLEQVEASEPVESEIVIEEEYVLTDTNHSPRRAYAIAAGGLMTVFGLLLFRRKRRKRRHRVAESLSDN